MIHRPQLIIATLLVLLAAIPTTMFLMQDPQETRSRASASTTLEISPNSTPANPLEKKVGEQVLFDVIVNPGSNLPSLVKLELQYDPDIFSASSSAFVANSQAFPSTIEGPITSNGKVLISVSIGPDSTKVIQKPTKVGTLTLTTKAVTNGSPSEISFGTRSQVLSLAQSDESNENVLSTTTPSYIAVVQGITPTIEQPTATILPSTFPTIGLSPTTTPMPSPTFSAQAMVLSFNVFMHGIGSSGDNANPFSSQFSNKQPQRPTRDVTVYIYDDQNKLAKTQSGSITYDVASGTYKGIVDLGTDIQSGDYTIRVKEGTHLRRLLPGIQRLNEQALNTMPDIALVAGDVNNDNTLNILDYNLVIGCYSDLLPAVSCTDENKIKTDLNDNNEVNQFDYNLFLREITVQSGN